MIFATFQNTSPSSRFSHLSESHHFLKFYRLSKNKKKEMGKNYKEQRRISSSIILSHNVLSETDSRVFL